MTRPPHRAPLLDHSRDRRIEDPSNLWLIHPLGRRLLPLALRAGVSANMVSLGGLAIGATAALSFAHPGRPAWIAAGLVLAVLWLVMDGLDGMVARATGTASPLGRVLDGLCDHGVFILIYVALALTIGTGEAWALAFAAGGAHALQSSLYEGERARFHRRARGEARRAADPVANSPAVRLYDALAGTPERLSDGFERRLASASDSAALGRLYAAAAVAPMRLLALQTANVRVAAIALAALAGDPRLFWWFEIGPLTLAALVGLAWHRRVERTFLHSMPAASVALTVREQGQ
ncbi:hypothetical protein GCM10011380_13190 [Sphingomonas metalli]|uniref:CDP-alcohol phosphatidyltransferase family protein n=1 Tax=Sphingomonas metalli TaxID=1779358 RepID=A0A916WQI5_9SPHN|nr:CDP-alcohol phosphatidyltransferase family protein [Sphingomonas metalli]GGB24973.1 hypothetical protein GCM10011380_13190 [Sphingomonas metalli]